MQVFNQRLGRMFAGLLLGAAVGDPFGLPPEGLSTFRLQKLCPGWLRHLFVFGRGMFSDDTEHAFITAQALLETGGDVECFRRLRAWKLRRWVVALLAGADLARMIHWAWQRPEPHSCSQLKVGVPKRLMWGKRAVQIASIRHQRNCHCSEWQPQRKIANMNAENEEQAFQISQNGELKGSFSADHIRSMIVAGACKPTDLGLRLGQNEWRPLYILFNLPAEALVNKPEIYGKEVEPGLCGKVRNVPIRIVILYILLLFRVLASVVVFIKNVPASSATQAWTFTLSAVEFGFAALVIVMLIKKLYLAIVVFRPYIILSHVYILTSAVVQAVNQKSSPDMQMMRDAYEHPIAVLVGSAAPGFISLIFWIWFGWHLSQPAVKSYLNSRWFGARRSV
jgi:hypothetical protein